jgi:hypothetical protein
MYLKSQNIIMDHKQKHLQSFIQTQKPNQNLKFYITTSRENLWHFLSNVIQH